MPVSSAAPSRLLKRSLTFAATLHTDCKIVVDVLFGVLHAPLKGHCAIAVRAQGIQNVLDSAQILAFGVFGNACVCLDLLHRAVVQLFGSVDFPLKYKFSGITHILGECNYTRERVQENLAEDTLPTVRAARLMHSHMSLQHLVEFLEASDLSRLKQIYLVHLSAENSDEAEMKRQIQRLTGAEVYVC